MKIPKNAQKVNRITDEMLIDKPHFEDVYDEILNIIEQYPLVGHNVEFDVMMLKSKFEKINIEWTPRILFCTMKLCGGNDVFDDFEYNERRAWKKLAVAAAEHGVKPGGEYHDATVDARVSGELFIAMKQREIEEMKTKITSLKSEVSELDALGSRLIDQTRK